MKFTILWFIGKGLDYLSTYQFVLKYGWKAEVNPFAEKLYNLLGWSGIIFITFVLGIMIFILDKGVGKYKFVKICLWIFVILNILNPLRNFWIYYF